MTSACGSAIAVTCQYVPSAGSLTVAASGAAASVPVDGFAAGCVGRAAEGSLAGCVVGAGSVAGAPESAVAADGGSLVGAAGGVSGGAGAGCGRSGAAAEASAWSFADGAEFRPTMYPIANATPNNSATTKNPL